MYLVWHPLVHQKWAHERLYFWRMGFFPTYDREEITAGLEKTLEDHDIRSYTCYELIGIHDLLLRAWVPDSESYDDVQDSLISNLGKANLRLCDAFVVSRTVRHWVWGEGRPLEDPNVDDPAQILTDDGIRDVQERPELHPVLVKKYRGAKLIGDAEHSKGLKFVLVVTSLTEANSLPVKVRLQERLISILDNAPKGISERSLYAGDGFGRFLIMGRVEFDKFHLIGEYFVNKLNDELNADFVARTYTHLAAFDTPLIRQDRLLHSDTTSVDDLVADMSVEDLLRSEESAKLEVKGSAFLDLKRLIEGDHKPNWEHPKVIHSVLKTITAFLNSEGGRLIIGALESTHFKEASVMAQLGAVPVVGSYYCVGVEVDYIEGGWDAFERRLREIIQTRIAPNPDPHITINRRVVRERVLCQVVVEPSAHEWFYLNGDELYVRHGNKSDLLSGPDADRHRISHPRG
ncbi:MAG TPA: ATP-binding protein [Solirubrobacterales bacterium]|nr:ATP-binding protein [Solirubrobacterales bacterium]